MKSYEYIIIGAGHNGLVAAAYLAKKGKKVLVLERRNIVGGQAITESFGNGFSVDTLHAGGTLRPDIIKDLRLATFGLQLDIVRKPFILIQPDSQHLMFDGNLRKASESIKRFSEKDAANWGPFLEFMSNASRFIHSANATIMPRLPQNFDVREGVGMAELLLSLRLMGGQDMMRIIRGIPMTAEEFADEWFESDVVKASIASIGIHGISLGVMGAGTGYTLMHNWANRGGMSHTLVRGGVGKISEALESAVKSYGGQIRINAEVKKILIQDMTTTGVVLSDGEEIFANTVISAADPKHTFRKLVGAMELPPEFVWNVQSIKMRGTVAKIHLQTDGNHGLPEGTLALAPSLKYLEKAYDAAKYGQISEQPYLEVTALGNIVSIHFQYAPYVLKHSTWDVERDNLERLAINTLGDYFPNLKSSIINTKTLTAADLEESYGLTEGDLNHGQLMLDQLFFMRPIPGWSNHKTPIKRLYLCGGGVHGGGGISGASGRNAAKVLLK